MHIHVRGPDISRSWHFPGNENALFAAFKSGSVPVQDLPPPRPWTGAEGRVEPFDPELPVDGVVTLRPAGFVAQVGKRRTEHTWKGFTSVALVLEGEQVGAWVTQTITSKAWGPTPFKKNAYPFFWAGEAVPNAQVPGYLWADPKAACAQSLTLAKKQIVWRDDRKKELSQKMPFRDRVAMIGHAGKALEYTVALQAAGEAGKVSRTVGEWITGLEVDRILDYRVKKGLAVTLSECHIPAERWPEVLAHFDKCKIDSLTVFVPADGDFTGLARSTSATPVVLRLHAASHADLDLLAQRPWAAVEVTSPDGLDLVTWLKRLDAPRVRVGTHVSEGTRLETTPQVLRRMCTASPVDRSRIAIKSTEGLSELVGVQGLSAGVLEIGGPALGDAGIPMLESLLPCVRETLEVRNHRLTADGIARLEAHGVRIVAGPPWEDPAEAVPDPVPEGVPLSCLDRVALASWLRTAGGLLRRALAGRVSSEAEDALSRLEQAASFQPIRGDYTREALALVHSLSTADRAAPKVHAFYRTLRQVSFDHQFHAWDSIPDVPPGDRGMSHWHEVEDEAYATDIHRGGKELSAAILHLAEPAERDAIRSRLTSAS